MDSVALTDSKANASGGEGAASPDVNLIETLLQMNDIVDGESTNDLRSKFEDILDNADEAPISFWVSHVEFQKLMNTNKDQFQLLPLLQLATQDKRQKKGS